MPPPPPPREHHYTNYKLRWAQHTHTYSPTFTPLSSTSSSARHSKRAPNKNNYRDRHWHGKVDVQLWCRPVLSLLFSASQSPLFHQSFLNRILPGLTPTPIQPNRTKCNIIISWSGKEVVVGIVVIIIIIVSVCWCCCRRRRRRWWWKLTHNIQSNLVRLSTCSKLTNIYQFTSSALAPSTTKQDSTLLIRSSGLPVPFKIQATFYYSFNPFWN